MSDVARLAGVSIKTVSRVVNAEAGVHAETAERVLVAIERLGFRRNVGAFNLRRGSSTGTIGLVLEDVANPFYSGLTRAAEKVARRFGRRVLAGSSDEDADLERELALEFCARRVDGLIVVPAGRRHGYLVPEIASGTPVVFVDRPPGELVADTVLVDNVAAAATAVGHLVAHGHRRIAFLGDVATIFTAAERLAGFREGCVRHGIPFDERLVVMGPHTPETVAAAIRDATAVVTGNNRITVLVLRGLAGRRDRPALVGFDDFELADLLDPPVTVVSLDPAELGTAAAELLFARLNGDREPPRRVVLSARLTARGSGETPP